VAISSRDLFVWYLDFRRGEGGGGDGLTGDLGLRDLVRFNVGSIVAGTGGW